MTDIAKADAPSKHRHVATFKIRCERPIGMTGEELRRCVEETLRITFLIECGAEVIGVAYQGSASE